MKKSVFWVLIPIPIIVLLISCWSTYMFNNHYKEMSEMRIPSIEKMIDKISTDSAEETKGRLTDILIKFRSVAEAGREVDLAYVNVFKEFFKLQILLNLIWLILIAILYFKKRVEA